MLKVVEQAKKDFRGDPDRPGESGDSRPGSGRLLAFTDAHHQVATAHHRNQE